MSTRSGHISKKSPLDKKVPTNAKYEGTKSKVNSGCNVNKVKTISTREYLQKKNEPFYRIGPSSMNELLGSSDVMDAGHGQIDYEAELEGGPRIVSHEAQANPEKLDTFIVLDVRPREEFIEGRIVTAKSFPASLLNQDRITADILRLKNKEGTLIIIYDIGDEKLSAKCANSFIEKGYENIFVLSGGLREFAERFPAGIEGQAPLPSAVPKSSSSSRSVMGSSHGRVRTAGSTRSATSSRSYKSRGSKGAKLNDNDDISEVGSTMSVADSVISRAQSKKKATQGRMY